MNAANDNRSAERRELASWALAVAFYWVTIAAPVAAILWGEP